MLWMTALILMYVSIFVDDNPDGVVGVCHDDAFADDDDILLLVMDRVGLSEPNTSWHTSELMVAKKKACRRIPTAGPCSGKLVVNFSPMSHARSAKKCKHEIQGVQAQCSLLTMGVGVSWPVFNFANTIALLCRLVCHRSAPKCSAWYKWKVRFTARAVSNYSILRYLELHPWKGWGWPLMKFNCWVVWLLTTCWNSLLSSFDIFHHYKIDSVFETTNPKCESATNTIPHTMGKGWTQGSTATARCPCDDVVKRHRAWQAELHGRNWWVRDTPGWTLTAEPRVTHKISQVPVMAWC